MGDAPVSTVVVSWNSLRKTQACIESIRKQTTESALIVVDNASTDGSKESLQERSDLTLIAAPTNEGFARGANRGIARALDAGASFVWLLNSDAVAQPAALAEMIAAISAPRVGVVGAVIARAGNEDEVEMWGGGRVIRFLATTTPVRDPATTLDYITGSSMLLDAEMLRDIGGLDERFFLYLEDVDLCLRARRAGWHLKVVEASRVVHEGGGSSEGEGGRPPWVDQHHAFSSGLFIAKHGGGLRVLGLLARALGMTIRRVLRMEASRIAPAISALVRGFTVGRDDPSRHSHRHDVGW